MIRNLYNKEEIWKKKSYTLVNKPRDGSMEELTVLSVDLNGNNGLHLPEAENATS